ncbi:MAG: SDR family oxidoreductase [bacterium]|nr:SDR family oxidoreductase [bacterium]
MAEKLISLVTGGGKGIGRAIALRLAKETKVVVIGRTAPDLASVCDEICAGGGSAFHFTGDVRDGRMLSVAMRYIDSNGWVLRNVICNAGIAKGGPTHEFPMDKWKEIMDVNVNGTFNVVRETLPLLLREKRGNICIISSTAGLQGFAYTAAYCASKHALVGLARSLAQEYGKQGIVAVPICPGYVDTEMTARTIHGLMKRSGITEAEARAKVAKTNPQNRIISTEEIAEAVAMVCSGKYPALNGSPLILSGGS